VLNNGANFGAENVKYEVEREIKELNDRLRRMYP